jgi:hypothetical protein
MTTKHCPPALPALCLALAALAGLLPAARWTVMVYMAADNGMSNQSYVDLLEMAQVGSTADVNIVVQVDHPETDSWPRPRRLRVEPNHLQLLAELPELDMADPATLTDFARFCRNQYPAENYMLVLWDHGNGWQKTQGECRMQNAECRMQNLLSPLSRASSFMYDQSSGNAMSVAEGRLRTAMLGVRGALGKRVSILAFDACLMQMLEVMYEVRDCADICVGSEDLVPFNGFPYREFLDLLVRQSSLTPRAYARGLPQLYCDAYHQGSQGDEDVTLSSVDLTGLEAAAKTLNPLLAEIGPQASSDDFRSQRRTVQTFSCENIPPDARDDNIDLIDWLARLPALVPAASRTAIKTRFEKLVLACAVNGNTLSGSRGIAAWFPDNYLALKYNHADYRQLEFARDVVWPGFLNRFFNADDVKPSRVSRVELQPDRVGRHNDFRLRWEPAYDLAPVTYEVREIAGPLAVFNDPAENLDRWFPDGFTLSSTRAYSGNYSFFSGLGDNLNNTLTLRAPLNLARGGLLSFHAWYSTAETPDSSGGYRHDVCYLEGTTDPTSWTVLDSLYGYSGEWPEYRYFLPDSNAYWLRFRFKTSDGAHITGVYVDELEVLAFSDWRRVTPGTRDSAYCVFNALRDTLYYAVVPRDSFGNVGFVSPLRRVAVPNYAEPYSLPGPITGQEAVLVCDYPAGETPDVTVYTLAGEQVRRFPSLSGPRLTWDTRNERGELLASGMYLVVVKGSKFKSIGRIAIAR